MIDFEFEVGDVIHHRRYGYRGVVAECDPECRATEAWYEKNQTQPRRDQPWYHVLVDGGAMTYVAQENLELDPSKRRVEHPLVSRCFRTFHNGRYFAESLS